MFLRRFWPLFSLELLLVIVSACGGGYSPRPVPPVPAVKSEFVYVRTLNRASGVLGEILSFKLDTASGSVSQTSDTELQTLPLGFAVDPNSKFFYSSNAVQANPGGVVYTYLIDPSSGALTFVQQFVVSTPICAPFGCPQQMNGPGPLAIAPNGKFLFYGSNVVGAVDEVIGALSADTTGNLNSVPGSPFPADQAPFAVAVHPSGNFVYTENVDSSAITVPLALKSISVFSVAADGVLTPASQSPFVPLSDMHFGGMIFHPSGKYLYIANGSDGNGISVWSIDQGTGMISALPSPLVAPQTTLGGGAFDPTGKFLYLPRGSAGGISVFSVDINTGNLTEINGSPFITSAQLVTLMVDPSGQFVFAGDSKQGTLSEFKIDKTTGSLTAAGTPLTIGSLPISIAIVKAP